MQTLAINKKKLFNQNTVGSAFAIISPCNIQCYWTTFCAVRVKGDKLKCLQDSLVKCMYKMYFIKGPYIFLDPALKVHSLSLQL